MRQKNHDYFPTEAPASRRVRRRRRRDRLDAALELLQRIDAALVVRDPGTARSADAYEGLRRQVLAAASDRRKHLVQLTELSEALRRGDDMTALRSRAEEWLLQANITVVDDPRVTEAFEFAGDGDGDAAVIRPAYVDASTGALIRPGRAERRSAPRQSVAPDTASAPTEEAPLDHETPSAGTSGDAMQAVEATDEPPRGNGRSTSETEPISKEGT